MRYTAIRPLPPKEKTDEPEPLLGPSQVAKLLGVSPAWVRDHATRKDPRIPSVKVGRLLRFRPVDVSLFIHTRHSESRR